MHLGDEVSAQERGEGVGVDAVIFDLRIGDDAVFRRVREHHRGDPGGILQQIVEHVPVPTGLDDDLTWLAKFFEVRGKSRRSVVVDLRFVELASPAR